MHIWLELDLCDGTTICFAVFRFAFSKFSLVCYRRPQLGMVPVQEDIAYATPHRHEIYTTWDFLILLASGIYWDFNRFQFRRLAFRLTGPIPRSYFNATLLRIWETETVLPPCFDFQSLPIAGNKWSYFVLSTLKTQGRERRSSSEGEERCREHLCHGVSRGFIWCNLQRGKDIESWCKFQVL